MKNCNSKTCNQSNPQILSNFYKCKKTKDGLQHTCKHCYKEYKEKNKINIKKRDDNYYLQIGKNRRLTKTYNITIENYNEMFQTQNGCCAICNKHQSEFKAVLNVDHDHLTGKIRGLLCSSCNRAIGFLKDDNKIVESALNYLNKHKEILKVVK